MVISQTPLRISLVGGGTDLKSFYHAEDGMVVSSAIDKYVYVIVKERFDEKIYINYSQKEIVDNVIEIRHDLVREAMRITGVLKGVEITTLADIPSEGSGLGSSSSITVGLLNALYSYAGMQVTAEHLAREACDIEIDICKKPIGRQDQYIAAYGSLNKITFHPDDSVSISKLSISNDNFRKLGSNLLLFFTRKTRDANIILEKQKNTTENKREVLRAMREHAPKILTGVTGVVGTVVTAVVKLLKDTDKQKILDWISQTIKDDRMLVFVGSLALLFTVPVVGGLTLVGGFIWYSKRKKARMLKEMSSALEKSISSKEAQIKQAIEKHIASARSDSRARFIEYKLKLCSTQPSDARHTDVRSE